ncbi:RNA pseudouridine synthase 4 [Pyrus ussuriensis x Pyrus communis]|uniref:RNA pseudouridine synthase 4 n=1 Tax=Pyrus ussuriensis x Pyrus communis TaxID=2448454 RepID=A0A5N5I9K1_9ROSA|nr:RNA pseudouridine synthase 4 [Pyrus ussuriensis x Pyrus communis]
MSFYAGLGRDASPMFNLGPNRLLLHPPRSSTEFDSVKLCFLTFHNCRSYATSEILNKDKEKRDQKWFTLPPFTVTGKGAALGEKLYGNRSNRFKDNRVLIKLLKHMSAHLKQHRYDRTLGATITDSKEVVFHGVGKVVPSFDLVHAVLCAGLRVVRCGLCNDGGHEEQCDKFNGRKDDDRAKPYGRWFQDDVSGKDYRKPQGKKFDLDSEARWSMNVPDFEDGDECMREVDVGIENGGTDRRMA